MHIYPSDTHSHLNDKNRTYRNELGVYSYYIGGKMWIATDYIDLRTSEDYQILYNV